MFQHRVINPSTFCTLVATFGFALLCGSAAQAADAAKAKAKSPARSCQATLQSAQEKMQAGQLVEASQLLASCSDESCGAAVWHECVAKNTELRATLPSVIPVVVDEDGEPRVDVEVKIDGRVLTSQINGRALAVDPGPHEFSFSVGSDVFASTKLTIIEGERNRTVSVTSPPAKHPGVATTASK